MELIWRASEKFDFLTKSLKEELNSKLENSILNYGSPMFLQFVSSDKKLKLRNPIPVAANHPMLDLHSPALLQEPVNCQKVHIYVSYYY